MDVTEAHRSLQKQNDRLMDTQARPQNLGLVTSHAHVCQNTHSSLQEAIDVLHTVRLQQELKMMHGWGFAGGRAGFPQRFEEQYHCYSVAYADKAHLEVCSRTMPIQHVLLVCTKNNVVFSLLPHRKETRFSCPRLPLIHWHACRWTIPCCFSSRVPKRGP